MDSSYNKKKNILFISELPDNTKQLELESFFYDYKSDIQYMQIDSNMKLYDIFNARKQKATIIFKTPEKAAEARNNLNMRKLKGKALNIMWHETDNSIRYNNKANLFIKGIPRQAQPRDIYELFAKYGEIISCKICENEYGDLLGYGYINYYNLESAEEAIANLNKRKFLNSELEVLHFQKKNERLQENQENCSIYIKNIPKPYLNIDALKKLFSKYGTITFAQIFEDRSRHFAIISFTSAENANKAKDEMNEKKLDPKDQLPLYVDLLQKKSERKRMLITKIVDNNNKLNQETKNCNLYVKNLPRELTEKQMKEIFSKIGEVKSVKIDKILIETRRGDKDIDILESRGFGYVCYNKEEDAKKAIQEFNGKKLPGFEDSPRPVLINKFMPKNERKQYLSKLQAQQNFFPLAMNDLSYPMMYSMPGLYKNNFNFRRPYQPPVVKTIAKIGFHPQIIKKENSDNNQNDIRNDKSNNNKDDDKDINNDENDNDNNEDNDDEPNYEYMKSLENEEQQKDYLGEFLFKKIEQHPLAQSKNLDVDIISRITGMILGIGNIEEIYGITSNDDNITARIQEALELLKIK